jgi:hypothetical protein
MALPGQSVYCSSGLGSCSGVLVMAI